MVSQTFLELEAQGYDQVTTGSLWQSRRMDNFRNIGAVAKTTRKIIAPGRWKGILQTSWVATLSPCLQAHLEAIRVAGEAKANHG